VERAEEFEVYVSPAEELVLERAQGYDLRQRIPPPGTTTVDRLMPQRTNLFQQVVVIIHGHMAEGATNRAGLSGETSFGCSPSAERRRWRKLRVRLPTTEASAARNGDRVTLGL
jgi:hypothetical protein